MPIVFDLSDVSESDVQVGASPLAELMAALHVLAEPGHHPERLRDVAAVEAQLTPSLERRSRSFAPLWARFRLRACMPLTAHPRADIADELEDLSRLPEDAFVAMAAEAILGRRSELTQDLDSPAGQAAFIAACRPRSEAREELAGRLLQDPGSFQRNLVEFLRECVSTYFESWWTKLEARLVSESLTIREKLARESLPWVIADLSPGSYYLPDSERVVYDKLQNAFVTCHGRELRIMPSSLVAPHVIVKDGSVYGSTTVPIILQFPVGVSSTWPTLVEVRHRLQVLADERRLEVCRHLLNEDCTTSELAERTGMTAPQVSRHLGRLRDAGLLVSVRDGRLVRHRLRAHVVASLGRDLLARIVK